MSKPTPPNELETLALQAEGLTDTAGPTTGPDAEPEAPAGQTNAQIIAMGIALCRDVFCTATTLNSPRQHLDEQAVTTLGDTWGAVCDKHGWNLNDSIAGWGVEIAAIAVTAQIGFALHRAVTDEIASRNAKPVQAETVDPVSGD